jgi:putative hemolysin
VIVANHPLGALDGMSLLKMVGEIRRDVKIVASDMLLNFKPLAPLFLAVDNISKSTHKSSVAAIVESLNNDEAVIVFPAGEVSRIRPNGDVTVNGIKAFSVSLRKRLHLYYLCTLGQETRVCFMVAQWFTSHLQA